MPLKELPKHNIPLECAEKHTHCFFLFFFAFSLALFFSRSDNTAQHHKKWMGNSKAMQPLCSVEHTHRKKQQKRSSSQEKMRVG